MMTDKITRVAEPLYILRGLLDARVRELKKDIRDSDFPISESNLLDAQRDLMMLELAVGRASNTFVELDPDLDDNEFVEACGFKQGE